MSKLLSRLALLAFFFANFLSSTDAAPPEQTFLTIEESWEMRVNTVATAEKTCPQWSTNFPLGNGFFFVVTFNYRDFPSVEFGGIQLQIWQENDSAPTDVTEIVLDKVSFDGETLRWTQVVNIKAGGQVDLKLTGCSSQSWGQNINTTSVSDFLSGTLNFNSYNPANSVVHSGVSFGKNRVDWFGIVEARAYNDKGKLVMTDTTPRPVVDNTASP